jgi:hypothetical protein
VAVDFRSSVSFLKPFVAVDFQPSVSFMKILLLMAADFQSSVSSEKILLRLAADFEFSEISRTSVSFKVVQYSLNAFLSNFNPLLLAISHTFPPKTF